ncbi:MAG: phosphoglycerate kinase [Patescibacteria group bacterium]
MSFKLRTLKSVDLKNKRVLLRLDLNVPQDENGMITERTRILETLPTLRYLLEQGAKIIVLSHLGRPDGKKVEKYKLDKVAEALSEELGQPVRKLDDCLGEVVTTAITQMNLGEVIMLENTRFYPEEEANDDNFSKQLAALGDLFVSDAFGTVHRAHASTAGIAKYLPAYAGLLLEKEVTILSGLLENPAKPMTLIAGGAKIDTKIGILSKFLDLADTILIGGALANTFLAAEDKEIGFSLSENDKIPVAKKLLKDAKEKGVQILLPVDVCVAKEISEHAETQIVSVNEVQKDMKILDLGTQTIENFIGVLKNSKTIVWNGPMGLHEMVAFETGTRRIAEAVAESSAATILGGGDTIDAIHKFHISPGKFTHISTGGGAMLEFLQGNSLPGVEVLLDK